MRAAPNQSVLWQQEVWDVLLEHIERGLVIPVIGPELAVVFVDGVNLTVDEYVAQRLAEQLGLPVGDDVDGDGRFTLNDVVAGAIRDNKPRDMLYAKVNSILSTPIIKPSASLSKLAEITDFRLYVSLTFDSLLHSALVSVGRGKPKDIEQIGYAPREMPRRDLPDQVRNLAFPVVYHLLGRHCALPEFVISEDDLLEYIVGLHSESSPIRLLDEMKSHSLLFLGGDFPDWLSRMVLRLTKQRRLSLPRETPGAIEVLADRHSRSNPSLTAFLCDFSPHTKIYETDAEAFIDELYVRWRARRAGADQSTSPSAFVFLSYTREDRAAAMTAADAFGRAGIEYWLDEHKLQGGESYWTTIEDKISSCTVFMPLLSKNTEARKMDANFRREWAVATQRSQKHSPTVRFLMPIIVDDLQVREVKEAPEVFLAKHITAFDGGRIDQTYLTDVRELLRGSR